jgi:hypothetical protein
VRIVVCHTKRYGRWLRDCLRSLEKAPYKVEVIEDNGWVTDHLKFAANLAQFWQEPFFMLNETTVITDPIVFDIAQETPGPTPFSPGYLSFQGKFTPQQLKEVKWPTVKNKRDDVILGEGHLLRDTLAPGLPVLDPEFTDPDPNNPDNFVTRYGRKNLVLRGKYAVKYKATWDIDKIR